MRGDRPLFLDHNASHATFTPHARGSTPWIGRLIMVYAVYPACAGIDLKAGAVSVSPAGLPRMRGDRPLPCFVVFTHTKFTPHARGSTPHRSNVCMPTSVYPACAGIDRRSRNRSSSPKRLPRMRGDRPHSDAPRRWCMSFTPHARGSTSLSAPYMTPKAVYPACAGIDLQHLGRFLVLVGLPRMRGDRPPLQ